MFTRDPEVRHLHEAGLGAGLRGDFDAAHKLFDEARLLLPAGHDSEATADSYVQLGIVQRDSGFTYVREAIATGDSKRITNHALPKLTGSHRLLRRPLASFFYADTAVAAADRHAYEAELFAERGATLNCIARMATARRVVFGELEPLPEWNEWKSYYRAHKLFQHCGNNGYFLVGNAMHTARAEQTQGQSSEMRRWVARAAGGLAWTATHDRPNLKPAVRTFVGRLPHLQSQQTAIDSVRVKP